MLRMTLDTNCIVDLEEDGPAADAIRALIDAHEERRCAVFIPAISASEWQKDGCGLSFFDFEERLEKIGLNHLPKVLPMTYLGIAFFGHALLGDEKMLRHEQELHTILFGHHQFEWDPSQNATAYRKWLNRKCDVQAIWSHINAGNDVFVTSDANFHKTTKRARLIAAGAKQLETPFSAAALLA